MASVRVTAPFCYLGLLLLLLLFLGTGQYLQPALLQGLIPYAARQRWGCRIRTPPPSLPLPPKAFSGELLLLAFPGDRWGLPVVQCHLCSRSTCPALARTEKSGRRHPERQSFALSPAGSAGSGTPGTPLLCLEGLKEGGRLGVSSAAWSNCLLSPIPLGQAASGPRDKFPGAGWFSGAKRRGKGLPVPRGVQSWGPPRTESPGKRDLAEPGKQPITKNKA